tara:strand:- start:126 stop:479 length:354 start_codon:yes stop_codon:yes gene_type:complete
MFDKETFDADLAHTKLEDDDVAVVIRPAFNKEKWTGKVDLSALIMPVTKLKDEEHEIVKDSMYALVTCFHLLNTDKDFGERVADEMDRMAASGELGNIEKPVKVTHLSSWTKTKGNA